VETPNIIMLVSVMSPSPEESHLFIHLSLAFLVKVIKGLVGCKVVVGLNTTVVNTFFFILKQVFLNCMLVEIRIPITPLSDC